MDDESVEELERQSAAIAVRIAEKQRLAREDRENRSTSNGAKVLVHNSPSPKKKRTREDEVYHRASRPHAPSFHDSTQAGPPVFSHADSFTARSNKIASSSRAFASHESALPRESSLLKGLEDMEKKRKRETERKDKVEQRSTGFALGGSSRGESSSRAGGERSSGANANRERSTRKGKEREKQPATKRSAAELELASALAVKPAMARHVPAKAVPGPPPTRRRVVEKPDESESDDEDGLDVVGGPPKDAIKRRKDWTVIETLEVGPRDHKWSKNDPLFEKTEPNSGIRFRASTPRQISHEQLQLHLSDRYHLSPQQLYSLARTTTNTNVEIDVDRDFIVIGVLAWKDETRYVSAPKAEAKPVVARKPWEHVNGAKEGASVPEEQRDVEAFGKREQTAARRYLRFTFVDLASEESAASGTGTLNLMLFEATKEDETVEEDGYRVPRYRGGSGGAYEKFWKEAPGAVVAILNPRVSRNKPQPGRPNVLTITPESADAMMVIGQARDLRSCEALRRDTGKACGDWCDARVSSICEYHTNLQLKRTSSRRAETFSANSSLLASATFDKKKFNAAFKPPSKSSKTAPCDPEKKIGLLPRNPTISMQEGAKTYVVSSYLPASGPSSRSGPARGGSVLTAAGLRPASILHTSGSARYIPGVQDGLTVRQHEKDRKEREMQNAIRKEAEQELMKKDLGKTLGGQYLELAAKARKAKAKADEKEEHDEREKAREKAKRRKRTKGDDGKPAERSSDSDDDAEDPDGKRRKKPFSTSAVRLIGYDPTRQGDTGIEEDEASRLKRLEAIDSLKAIARAPPSLGPPPGPRIRSVVAASTFGKPTSSKSPAAAEDDEDLPDMRIAKAGKPERVVAPPEDSDDDDDLVVLPKEVVADSPDAPGAEAE